MSDAPERIWADGNAEWDSGSWGLNKEFDGDVEYIRADLVEAAKRIWADGNVKYIRADLVEAAVKRALEGAADRMRQQIMAECDCRCPACEPRGYCMADRIDELEAERDDYAFKLAEANNTYSEMHVAMSEANDKLATCEKYRDAYAEMGRIGTEAYRDLEAKLEKVVKVLETIVDQNGYADDPWGIARTTLAELKGDT